MEHGLRNRNERTALPTILVYNMVLPVYTYLAKTGVTKVLMEE